MGPRDKSGRGGSDKTRSEESTSQQQTVPGTMRYAKSSANQRQSNKGKRIIWKTAKANPAKHNKLR